MLQAGTTELKAIIQDQNQQLDQALGKSGNKNQHFIPSSWVTETLCLLPTLGQPHGIRMLGGCKLCSHPAHFKEVTEWMALSHAASDQCGGFARLMKTDLFFVRILVE